MDKYAISNLVGEGSFGKVYKAIDKQSKTTVALKIISKVRFQPKANNGDQKHKQIVLSNGFREDDRDGS